MSEEQVISEEVEKTPAEETEIEIELEEEEEPSEELEVEAEEEPEEETLEEETETEEPEEDTAKTVPLSALEAERRKWKARLDEAKGKADFADRLIQTTGKDIATLNAEMDAMAVAQYEQAGVDPQIAHAIVAQQRQMADAYAFLNKQKYDIEVEKLKADPFFADVEGVRDELEAVANRTGMTLEQAYMATRGTQRMADYKREIEQGVLNRQAKKPKKVDTTGASTGTKVKPKLNLSSDEIAVADAAIKAGVFKSRAEYAKYKQKT